MKEFTVKKPKSLFSYVVADKPTLILLIVSGVLFNVGLLALPYFEGQLAQVLYDIIGGEKAFGDMLSVAITFFCVMIVVQIFRYGKRYFVRRLYNNTAASLRKSLYKTVINKKQVEIEADDEGKIMTRAISDIDAVAEGLRKIMVEVFDTGVLMTAYCAMLFIYDVKLAAICIAFVPTAYLIAVALKILIVKLVESHKLASEVLAKVTLDRISDETMYRVYSCGQRKNVAYANLLDDYEKKAARASVVENAMQPVYKAVVLIGVIFIVYLGGRNVVGTGWAAWNIATFTTFNLCFAKIADKASKSARLFNSVEKAKVSWQRILPMINGDEVKTQRPFDGGKPFKMSVKDVSFTYENGRTIFKNLTFDIKEGEKVGVTGGVACGKSTFIRMLLNERKYGGSIKICGKELKDFDEKDVGGFLTYLGHDAELISDTAGENISLGRGGDVNAVLSAVCLDEEIKAEDTVGNGGIRLSGGQQARLALARTVFNAKNLVALDDPFSAVDKKTESQILDNLDAYFVGRALILSSHRVYVFENFDKVIFFDGDKPIVSTHKDLLSNDRYRALYEAQKGGEA